MRVRGEDAKSRVTVKELAPSNDRSFTQANKMAFGQFVGTLY
jgi:hypothetical protein